MNLKEIMTVSGQSGLFRLISKGKNNLIVESLIDKKRSPVYAHQRASSLEEISVFTHGEDLPLKKVLVAIYEHAKGQPVMLPQKQNETELRNYFNQIVPDHDPVRVYLSDVRKILIWYNLLLPLEDMEWIITEDAGDAKPSDESKEPEAETE